MRLIDADAIPYTMLYKENWLKGTGVEKQGAWKDDIDALLTVDAVPVIRCKDCKHCMIFSMFTSKWYVCCRNEKGVDVNADDFCSKAERGNNETV